jgi:hypothetical protein
MSGRYLTGWICGYKSKNHRSSAKKSETKIEKEREREREREREGGKEEREGMNARDVSESAFFVMTARDEFLV